MIKIENYFKPSNVKDTLDGTVWGELSLAYDDLTMSILEIPNENGRRWHRIKIKKFVFLNIVRHLQQICEVHTLSQTYDMVLEVSNFSDYPGYEECVENQETFFYQPKNFYEKDFIWGGLYFVLTKLMASEELLERIQKKVNYATGNNTVHYFEKWVEALDETFVSTTIISSTDPNSDLKKLKTIFLYLTKFEEYYTQFNNLTEYPWIQPEIRENFIRPCICLIAECKAELGFQKADLGISPLPDKYPDEYLGRDHDKNNEIIGQFINKNFPHLYREDLFPILNKHNKKRNDETNNKNEDVEETKDLIDEEFILTYTSKCNSIHIDKLILIWTTGSYADFLDLLVKYKEDGIIKFSKKVFLTDLHSELQHRLGDSKRQDKALQKAYREGNEKNSKGYSTLFNLIED